MKAIQAQIKFESEVIRQTWRDNDIFQICVMVSASCLIIGIVGDLIISLL